MVKTGEDGPAGHGGQEREQTNGSRWAIGEVRNGGRGGRLARQGRLHGTEKISTSMYICRLFASVREFLWGEVGMKDSRGNGRIVRSVSERTTSGTVGTGDWNPPCAECPRPI